MAFHVEFTPETEQDTDGILEWLHTQQAGEPGERWFRELKKAIESLSTFPNRCALAPENASVPFEMRQLLYGRRPHVYRILFTITGEVAFVLRIRHGRLQRLGEVH